MLQLIKLQKSYGFKTILDNVNYQFPGRDIIALVGANGAGKTTLLNIICGLEEADLGKVFFPNGVRIGFLPQEPSSHPKSTVLEECLSGHFEYWTYKSELDKITVLLETDHSDDTLHEFERINTQFTNMGGYGLESKAHKILRGLGFKEEAIELSPLQLSGGWRMRLELAKIFLREPEFLILDEPTNHLDLPSLIWVEEYLRDFQGCVLFVSHDRTLLNRLAKKTLYLKGGRLREYVGNYDAFVKAKEEQQAQVLAIKQGLLDKRDHMQEFVDRFGAKASKATQAQSRAKQIDKLQDELDALDVDQADAKVTITLQAPEGGDRVLLKTENLYVGYKARENMPQKILSGPLNFIVEKGQKIVIIGANGVGKTSFLRTLVQEIEPISGKLEWGTRTKPVYFSQNQYETLNADATALDNVMEVDSRIGAPAARQLLGAFLFRGDDVFKPIKVLSGGEKNRVGLACVMAKRGNLLILDEPTNHLDMPSIDALTEALKRYTGTLVCVSHQRDFMNAFATHVIAFKENAVPYLFEGNIDDFLRRNPDFFKEKDETASQGQKTKSAPAPVVAKPKNDNGDKKKLETQINKLTAEVDKLRAELLKVEMTNYSELNRIQQLIDSQRVLLTGLEDKWLEG